MTHPHRTASVLSRSAAVTIAGASVVVGLAGCSAAGATTASAGDPPPVTHLNFKDGTYTAPGSYVSPGGEEHISVTLTLKKNVITAMKVVTVRADPTATGYEHLFESGIAAATIGRNINTLDIGVVAGSSLTSLGFNKALATIKADAKD